MVERSDEHAQVLNMLVVMEQSSNANICASDICFMVIYIEKVVSSLHAQFMISSCQSMASHVYDLRMRIRYAKHVWFAHPNILPANHPMSSAPA